MESPDRRKIDGSVTEVLNQQSTEVRRCVVHLPVYSENPYQPMLMDAQRALGWEVIDGGGGGNFLRSVLRRWKPDILHLHWLHPYLLRESRPASWRRGLRLLAEMQLIRMAGIKIVWTVHNLKNHDETHGDIELWLTRRFVRLCDLILTHGQFAVDAARERFCIPGAIPVRAIRHPSYIPQGPPSISRIQAREKLGVSDECFVLGFLGRVEPYKQVVELIHAFEASACRNSLLLIGGRASDQYVAEVEAAIGRSQRIRFENGYVPQERMATFLRASDIVTCPSKGILTSGSVLLAMSYGRSVIAPAEGCIPEEVGDTGYLYDGSQQGLQQAIELAMQQKGQLQQRGEAARERAAEASPQEIARQIIDQYCLLLNDRSDQGIQTI